MIFRQELRFNTKSILTWTLSILLFLGLFMVMFPAFEEESQSFLKVIENIPPAILQGVGIDINTLFSPMGFLSYLYGLIQLLLGISGVLYGLRLLGREKTSRATSFLFAKPMSWSRIFSQKLLVGLVSIIITNGALYLLWLVFQQMMSLDGTGIGKMMATGVVLQFFMLSLGALISIYVRRLENPIGLASGVAMGLYVIHVLGRLTELEWLHRLSPYYYVDPSRLLLNGNYFRDVGMLFGLALLLLAISYYGYVKRDKEA